MKSKPTSYLLGLVTSFTLYLITSYYLLLRDDYILERFSVALNSPSFLTTARHVASFLHPNLPSIFLLTIALLGSFYFYFKLIRLPPTTLNKIPWAKWLIPIVFLVIISYPGLSTDIFDYINTNRVAFLHHANPWVVPPQDFSTDPMIYFGSWNFRASVYPPVMFVYSSLIYLIFGSHVIASIVGFKLISLILWSLFLYLIWQQTHPRHHQLFLTLAFNPLILIEFLGNTHNDLVMAIPVLLAFSSFLKRRYLLSGIILSLGFWAKFGIAIYLPLMVAVLFIETNYRAIFRLISGFTLIFLIGIGLMGNSFFYLLNNLSLQFQLYLQSLPTIIRFVLLQTLGSTHDHLAISLQKAVNLPLLAFLILLSLHTITRKRLADRSLYLMILYLIFSAPMLQPWYAIWYLPLLPFLTSKKLLTTAIVFSCSLMLHYLIRNYSFYFGPNNFTWQIIIYLVMVLPPLFILNAKRSWYTRVSRLRTTL